MSKKDWSKIPSASDIGYEAKEYKEDTDKVAKRKKKIEEFSSACDEFYNEIISCVAAVASELSSDNPTVRVTKLEELLTKKENYNETEYRPDELIYGLKHHEKPFKGKFAKDQKNEETFTHWTMRRTFPEGVENPFIRAQNSLKEKKGLYLTDCSDPQRSKQFFITLSVVYPKPRSRIFHGLNKMPGDPEPPLIPPHRFNNQQKPFTKKAAPRSDIQKPAKTAAKKVQDTETSSKKKVQDESDDDDFKPKKVTKKVSKEETTPKKVTKEESTPKKVPKEETTPKKKKASLDDDEDEKPVKKSSKSKS